MPRSYKSTEVFLKGDPRYNNKLASKIINKIMLQGKKTTAQAIFYEAVDFVVKKVENVEPVDVFSKAIENIKPRVEVRSKRVGGASLPGAARSQQAPPAELAIRWLVDAARSKRGKPMAKSLAEEFFDAYNNQGAAVTKKEKRPQDGRSEQRLQSLRLVVGRRGCLRFPGVAAPHAAGWHFACGCLVRLVWSWLVLAMRWSASPAIARPRGELAAVRK
jgi:small subunit ribosomal protein S7